MPGCMAPGSKSKWRRVGGPGLHFTEFRGSSVGRVPSRGGLDGFERTAGCDGSRLPAPWGFLDPLFADILAAIRGGVGKDQRSSL
jgi:hypothetical protein